MHLVFLCLFSVAHSQIPDHTVLAPKEKFARTLDVEAELAAELSCFILYRDRWHDLTLWGFQRAARMLWIMLSHVCL